MDVIPPAWVDLGATGLLGLVFLFVILGWLVPKRWHDRALADLEKQIAVHAETIAVQRETIERLTTATQNLAIPAHTASTALRSIATQAEGSTTAKGGDE